MSPTIEMNEKIEMECLLDAIYKKYGYDFRDYANASLKRRLKQTLASTSLPNFSAMQHKVLHSTKFFDSVLAELTVNVTEMYRDPTFYKALRENVIPILKTYPRLNIWHAGCSTGEEVYSLAIMLKEENLLNRTTIYATDIDEEVLKKAKEGIYPKDKIKLYTSNYQKSGGKESFAEYYTAKFDLAIMNKDLKKNIVFSQHNLATDSVFGEMHLVICRNVLIYFNKELQNRSVGLFKESLVRRGVLALGNKETINFSKHVDKFKDLVVKEKIYQKKN